MSSIKELVSKKKKRYKENGYDLDLSYISENIVAMGYPAEKIESMFRNSMNDVVKLLEERHKDHYWIYNLCSEKNYDPQKFKNRVSIYPFDDHNPPKLESIRPFCEEVQKWLSEDSHNIAVIHCKAGKGRTGLMISCYLLHCGICTSAQGALNYYAIQRTRDGKGVTIPSQRRYVEYYEQLVKTHFQYKEVPLILKSLELASLPPFPVTRGGGVWTQSHNFRKTYTSRVYEIKRLESNLYLELDSPFLVKGDVKIAVFFPKNMVRLRKEKLFHFWFNTFFVHKQNEELSQHRHEKFINNSIIPNRISRTSSDSVTARLPKIDSYPSNTIPQRCFSTSSFSKEQNEELKLKLSRCELDKVHKDKNGPNFLVTAYFSQEEVENVDHIEFSNHSSHSVNITDSSSDSYDEQDSDLEESDLCL